MSLLNGRARLTPTQQRIMDLLETGPKSREELEAAIGNEMNHLRTLDAHLSMIRERIQPFGYDVVKNHRSGTWKLMQSVETNE